MSYRNKIKLQFVNESDKEKTDIDWLDEFYSFLQGTVPAGMSISEEIKLNSTQAFSIIYYLQEHLRVFPDNIEKCSVCNDLYDSNCEGEYFELEGKHYCGGCECSSEATYCYDCGVEVFKSCQDYDNGYYCTECIKDKKL